MDKTLLMRQAFAPEHGSERRNSSDALGEVRVPDGHVVVAAG